MKLMSSKILLLGASLSFTVIVLLPQNQALAVVGHNCLYDNKCDSGEVCATVVKMPTGTVTQCYNIDSIPDGASILITNEQTIKQVCSLIPNSTSRFPDSCKPAPTPPPGATDVQCKSDEVPVLNQATGLIAACQKKLPSSPNVASTSQQPVGECDFPGVLNPATGIPCLIKSIIGVIAEGLLSLAGALIAFAIDINKSIYSSNSLAKFGFDISLQITNMLFAAGIIAIALGTMFRRSFGMALLPRFVLVALLIYFSFWASTTVVKISDDITKLFIDAAQKSFSWDQFVKNFSGFQGNVSLAGAVGQSVTRVASIRASIDVTFVAFLTLVAIAVMFLIRYVYLTMLIVLLPLALFLSIFPGLNVGGAGSAWGKWTENFTRWIIFGPVMAFFIYLSFAALKSYAPSASTFTGKLSTVGDYIAMIFILLLGLMFANSLGVNGAATFNNAARGGINWAVKGSKNWAQDRALVAASRPFRGKYKIPLIGKEVEGDKLAARLRTIPVLGGLGLGRAASRLGVMGEEQLVKEKQKQFAGYSAGRLALSLPHLSVKDRVAAAEQLRKSKDLKEIKNLDVLLNSKMKETYEAAGKDFNDVQKALGMDIASYTAMKAEAAATDPVEKAKQQKLAREGLSAFYSKLSPQDLTALPINSIYSTFKPDEKDKKYADGDAIYGVGETMHEVLRATTTSALVNNKGYLARAASKVNSNNFATYRNSLLREVLVDPVRVGVEEKTVSDVLSHFDTDDATKEFAMQYLKENKKEVYAALTRTLSSRELGIDTTLTPGQQLDEAAVKTLIEESKTS